MSRPRKKKPSPTGNAPGRGAAPVDARRVRLCLAIVVGVIIGAYAMSLGNGFVYDDGRLIVNNPSVRSLSNIPGTFTHGYYPGLTYYRPLGLISHVLDYALWDLSASGYHLTNLLAHLICSLLVFVLFLRFLPAPSPFVATLGTVVFACHPATTSAVMPIAARESIFCLAFCAGSVLLVAKGTRAGYVGALSCLVLALLCKEIAVVLPGVWLATEMLSTRRCGANFSPRRLIKYVPCAVILAAYFVVRNLVLEDKGLAVPIGLRAAAFLRSWVYLLTTVLLPSVDLNYEPSPETWFRWHKTVAVTWVCVWGAIRATRPHFRHAPFVLFWLAWTVLTYLPTTNLAGQETRWDERYLLMPTVGMVGVVLTLLFDRLTAGPLRRSIIGSVSVAVVVVALGGQRYRFWKDDLAFYANWVRSEPQHAKAHLGLGIELAKTGRDDEAVAEFNEALRINPDFSAAHVRLGRVLLGRNQPAEAERHFQHAVRATPDYAEAHLATGEARIALGQFDQAVQACREALRLDPGFAEAHLILAAALERSGQPIEALAEYVEGLRLKPERFEARNNFGLLLMRLGRYVQAATELRRASAQAPDEPAIANNLAWLLATCPSQEVRNPAEALSLAQRVCSLSGPSDPSTLDTLAAAQAAVGRFSEAVDTARQAANLAEAAGLDDLARRIEQRASLYARGRTFTERVR